MNESSDAVLNDRPAVSRRPIVILGCPRSGTLLVARILGGHPGHFLITEHSLVNKLRSCPEDRSGIVDDDIWRAHFRFAPYELHGVQHSSDIPLYDASAVQQVRQAYLELAGAQRLVIKNPTHVLHVDLLREMFPDAQYVFCIRHPWHTLQSMTIKQKTSFLLRTNDFGTLPDDLLLRAARSWRAACDAYEQHRNEDWIVCRYEALVSDPHSTIRALFDFLELRDTEYYRHTVTLPRRSQHNYFPIKNQFRKSRYRRQILDQIDPGSRRFDYPTEVKSLPSSGWKHLRHLLRKKLHRGK